ncbi:histidine phosphatase family protein [candidate division KSB1 bacterium]|nr:histidine phosphatase family protein [candidate division KSB1 bacterium]NIR70926.1 histidine phosphatase family protein [candidate division KSB1 bacterium]NIS24678.1 histidine phosphatase family protein [candidate division KSB1 bacterium]NIT71580.1 histidine phosphatase family protein [candidate division KSB1 bacterium]NIU25278.1 histidine phosphatase family protein [candidate division KSB1 bacterium]
MKTIYLLRHAKAVARDGGTRDFDRSLVKKGKNDVKDMARRFKSAVSPPALIVSSPASRAVESAKLFAEEIGMKKKAIVEDEKIYEQGVAALLNLIKEVDEQFHSMMLVGHNPSFNQLAGSLTKDFKESIPKCGIVGIDFDITHWKDVKKGQGVLSYFDHPKKKKADSNSYKQFRKKLETKLSDSIAGTLAAVNNDIASKVTPRVQKASAKIAKQFVKQLKYDYDSMNLVAKELESPNTNKTSDAKQGKGKRGASSTKSKKQQTNTGQAPKSKARRTTAKKK